jgi:O-acetyl-ADP-ribose deacetylase (regulator of RNase III)
VLLATVGLVVPAFCDYEIEPMPLTYLVGDATQACVSGPAILVHIVSDAGGWGKGFVLAISKRWSAPEQAYRHWYRTRHESPVPAFALGEVQLVEVAPQQWVANMLAQKGQYPDKQGTPPIRYPAVLQCLQTVAQAATQHQASVHMPRIGCGLAGGRWEQMEELINQSLLAHNIPTYVYDFRK